jgi:hypothetical protein
MSNPINDWITDALHNWAQGHPIYSWLITHPVMLVTLLILILILFGGLLGVIGRLTENLWLAILRLPLKLLQTLLKPIPGLATMIFGRDALETKDNQIQIILRELETIRQQETELLQKLQKLL